MCVLCVSVQLCFVSCGSVSRLGVAGSSSVHFFSCPVCKHYPGPSGNEGASLSAVRPLLVRACQLSTRGAQLCP